MCGASSDCFQPRNAFPIENTSLYSLNLSVGMISHSKRIKQLFYYYVLEYVVHGNTASTGSRLNFYHEWEQDRTLDGKENTEIISGRINSSV